MIDTFDENTIANVFIKMKVHTNCIPEIIATRKKNNLLTFFGFFFYFTCASYKRRR